MGWLNETEQAKIRELCKTAAGATIDRFLFFRTNGNEGTIYLTSPNGYTRHPVPSDSLKEFLPRTFRINSEIALPESVSIRELITGPDQVSGSPSTGRRGRFALLDAVRGLAGHLPGLQSAQTFQQSAPQIFPAMEPIAKLLTTPTDQPSQKDRESKVAQINLARDLILKVYHIDPKALEQLRNRDPRWQ